MGLVEDALEGGVPRVLLGLGFAVAAPIVLPAVSAGARPLAKSLKAISPSQAAFASWSRKPVSR
jgi:hypothetical protein